MEGFVPEGETEEFGCFVSYSTAFSSTRLVVKARSNSTSVISRSKQTS